MLRVQFLGTGDAFGSGGRLQTCFCVSSEKTRFLLDCGASALSAMRGQGVDPTDISFVLLSHLHGDHFGGVPFLLIEGQLVSKRTEPLTIAGPPSVAERIDALMECMFPGSSKARRRFEVEIVELKSGERQSLGETTVTPAEVVHPSGAPALALRIELADRIIAYSGDTEWTDALLSVARDADLFIAEGYTVDKPVPFHLDVAALRANADRLGAHRTVLTHMGAAAMSCQADIGFEMVDDGMTIDL